MKKKIVFAAIAGFLGGVAFLFLFLRLQPDLGTRLLGYAPKPRDPMAAFRQSFFGYDQEDPFAALEKMREEMAEGMPDISALEEEGQEIARREDAEAIYYEIKGADQAKLSTRVEGGQLTIEGEMKKESGLGGFNAVMQSTFRRSFPLPPNVDEKKMEVISDRDKVVLKFPKKG
jgi:HSP20 family molecular chaperone IbpA